VTPSPSSIATTHNASVALCSGTFKADAIAGGVSGAISACILVVFVIFAFYIGKRRGVSATALAANNPSIAPFLPNRVEASVMPFVRQPMDQPAVIAAPQPNNVLIPQRPVHYQVRYWATMIHAFSHPTISSA
jgi:hypothetical protein